MPLPLGTESTANLYIFIISLHIKRKIFLTKEIIGLHSRAAGEKYINIFYQPNTIHPSTDHVRTMLVPTSYHVRSIPLAIEANMERGWCAYLYTVFTFREGKRAGKLMDNMEQSSFRIFIYLYIQESYTNILCCEDINIS